MNDVFLRVGENVLRKDAIIAVSEIETNSESPCLEYQVYAGGFTFTDSILFSLEIVRSTESRNNAMAELRERREALLKELMA
jgi:hypothetical protein